MLFRDVSSTLATNSTDQCEKSDVAGFSSSNRCILAKMQASKLRAVYLDKQFVTQNQAAIAKVAKYAFAKTLGAFNYCCDFIDKYAEISAPLSDLLQGEPTRAKKRSQTRLQWTAAHQQAFKSVRDALASPPVLRLFDPALPCRVAADSSAVAVGVQTGTRGTRYLAARRFLLSQIVVH